MIVTGSKIPGKVIFSRARHDYRVVDDFGIDGGQLGGYVRKTGGGEPIAVEIPQSHADLINDWNKREDKYGIVEEGEYKVVENYDFESFEHFKNNLVWGTRGKDGRQPLVYKNLIDCDSKHLQAILDTQPVSAIYREVITSILEDRNVDNSDNN